MMNTPDIKNGPTLLDRLDAEAFRIITGAKGQIVTEPDLLAPLQSIAGEMGFKIGMSDIKDITLGLKRKGKIEKYGTSGWKIIA